MHIIYTFVYVFLILTVLYCEIIGLYLALVEIGRLRIREELLVWSLFHLVTCL